MKIAIASDLHLEFGPIEFKNEGADVLILSGDILVASDFDRNLPLFEEWKEGKVDHLGKRQNAAMKYLTFLEMCSKEFPHVIYVAGNHEFYQGKWVKSLSLLKEVTSFFGNIYFLEREVKVIDDITFVGSTLWTDLNKGDPLTQHAISDMMNDYRMIVNDEAGFTKLRPSHTITRHKQSLDYIKLVTEGKDNEKFVVVGHHSPSTRSIPDWYRNDTLMNGAYSSDLSDFILDRPQIKLWTHGHTHEPFDYEIGSTRIVCNPRGYIGYETQAKNFKLKYVDVV
jgi:predicted phosphodiesterase